MINKDYRRTAGLFDYDGYEVFFRTTAGKEIAAGSVEIDFENQKIIIRQKAKE